jgi:serine/threonine protein phosphatase 1
VSIVRQRPFGSVSGCKYHEFFAQKSDRISDLAFVFDQPSADPTKSVLKTLAWFRLAAYHKLLMHSYVIGDIHGCLDELRYLVEALPFESGDRLVFLGDYIDRGPNSKGVLSYILELQAQTNLEIICLKGNHEDMFLAYLGLPGQHGDMFLYNGGYATLISYGVKSKQSTLDEITSQVSREHINFLTNLRTSFVMEPFICVHAGINPAKPLKKQTDSDLLWIRDEFIYNPHRLPYTVLFGHTPRSSVLFDLPYKIGLDTGLVYGNKLSCLEVVERALYQITRGEKDVRRVAIVDQWN